MADDPGGGDSYVIEKSMGLHEPRGGRLRMDMDEPNVSDSRRTMGDQLVDFLRIRKQHGTNQEIDWQAKRDTWVRSVESLYGLVQEMLRDSIASKDVTIRRFDTQVTEDFVGTYSIPVLEITIGNERVEFRPKGITVIGASGRVDIRGERDTVTLLRDQKDVKSGWTVVLQRVPSLRTAPLDRESLQYALERVMLPLP